jgi:hypothetical protein
MADKYQVSTAHRQCIIDAANEKKRSGEAGDLEKICIPIPEDSGWDLTAEWVWAEPISENVFAIKNIPAYAYGYATDDNVRTAYKEGAHEVVEVVSRGGHSNYRLISKETIKNGRSEELLNRLAELGCDWELANRIHASIDVPPTTDVYAVYGLLEEAAESGFLSFEEGFCGHPLKQQTTE